MKAKLTERQPEGILVDLEGHEVRPSGKTTLSLGEEQFAKFVGLLDGKLRELRQGRAVKPEPDGTKPDDQGRHP